MKQEKFKFEDLLILAAIIYLLLSPRNTSKITPQKIITAPNSSPTINQPSSKSQVFFNPINNQVIHNGNEHYLDVPYLNQGLECDGSPQIKELPVTTESCRLFSYTMILGAIGILPYENCQDLRNSLTVPSPNVFNIKKSNHYNFDFYVPDLADGELKLYNSSFTSCSDGLLGVLSVIGDESQCHGGFQYGINMVMNRFNMGLVLTNYNFQEIKKNIDIGLPMELGFSIDKFTSHSIVVIGYTDDYKIIVNDPGRNILTNHTDFFSLDGEHAVYNLDNPIINPALAKVIELK